MSSSPQKKRSPLIWVAVLASAVLAVAGLATFWWASTAKRPATQVDANAIKVTIHDDVCEPNDITVPAGRTTFVITNASKRILEWEILDGVMVVEERENIAPGFSQTMKVKLQPGKFEITCGLLSNPRGTLTVTPSAASDAEAAKPSMVAYIGPLAEYRVTLLTQAAALQKALKALDAAVKAGDLDQARQAYLQAHQAYARLEPMSDLFSDLDARLNVRPEYLEKREDDNAFVGLFRLERELYRANKLDQAQPIVDRLIADADTLRERVRALNIEPPRLATGASRLMQRSADRFANDAQSLPVEVATNYLQGSIAGAKGIAQLLSPLVTKADAALQEQVDSAFTAVDSQLSAYQQKQNDSTREALTQALKHAAATLEQINAKLGLD
ncbi:iron uptake system protein EfeO [Bordetella genomosp. 4]|uniref:Multidrug DMT transporter permease n=1 Tax=Bordetella genomosp. 4 TaxID=463044 RepID=A0A261TU24_9BORD|nr:iron uptake system protein EfeO [Bordetella genomosp. 4]OZI44290.1 multidrug DMT transporter permease [Bordetella genomosp. 4]OZI52925.1 multidrug DMT transporter permease [Bordetella genomosp. 4]